MSKTARQFVSELPGAAAFIGMTWKGKLLLLAATIVILWLWAFIFSGLPDALRTMRSRAADARSEKIVKDERDTAAVHESNANAASVNRQISEGRAADARAEKEKAAANSNLTAEPARRARQTYEKARRHAPVDAPALTDDELCAELRKRNVPCR